MSGSAPPPKPWERSQSASTSAGPSGKPWERPPNEPATVVDSTSAATVTAAAAPARPWERSSGSFSGTQNYSSPYSPIGANSLTSGFGSYGSRYGSGYGSGYGAGYGSGYGMGGYGSSMYGSGYGSGYGSTYGGGYGGSFGSGSMFGGMYGRGGYGGSMYGGGYGQQPPFDGGQPPAPPSSWQGLLAAINGVMQFFGRLSFLVDENAHAVHFFVSALLQLLDRFGSLYAELARFILRLIFRRSAKTEGPPGPPAAGSAPWENLWEPKPSS